LGSQDNVDVQPKLRTYHQKHSDDFHVDVIEQDHLDHPIEQFLQMRQHTEISRLHREYLSVSGCWVPRTWTFVLSQLTSSPIAAASSVNASRTGISSDSSFVFCQQGDVISKVQVGVCILAISRFYPRDAMLARVIAIATCLSVCPSVTRRYCVKTKNASVMISSPSGIPKILVI